MSDWIDWVLGAAMLLAVGLLLFLGAFLYDDVVNRRRAFDAAVACEAKQMQARRKTFSTSVVCVPSLSRRDTTTINLTGDKR